MTSRYVSATLLFLLACSAPESANRAARCDDVGQCVDGRVCYRGFCVLDEEVPSTPTLDADADAPGSMAPPSAAPGADASTLDASARRDAGHDLDAGSDADLEESADASVRAPSPPDAGPLPGAPSDAATAVVDAAPTDAGTSDDGAAMPPADAATDGDDRGEVNGELRRCLVLCGANENLCYSCFRALVSEYPEVCDSTGAGASQALLQSLCAFLCGAPGCGEP